MYRLFQTHHIRKEIALPELWDLTVPGNDTMKIPVPCCVESTPAFSRYKGTCKIETTKHFEGDLRLTFKGVGHTATVCLDGQHIGSHYGAYGEFSFLLKNQERKEHRICVEADNSYSEASALHVDNDYYSYLGITRPVILEQLEKAYIQWIHVTPECKDGLWKTNVTVCAENITDVDLNLTLKLFVSSKDASVAYGDGVVACAELPVSLAAGETKEFSTSIDCPGVEMYLPEHPVLYYLHAQLAQANEEAFDDLIDRFGFREVKVVGKQILFNGVPMKIKGFNRHEDFAEYGSCLPLAAMYRDIRLIKDTGANCVRTCHYPNDERFLDLCDENGLFVWEEAHGRGLSEEQMLNPHFMEQSRLTVREMITWHYNHPSIYVWGLLNECASETEYGRECYSELISLMRSLDSSRPITFASCRLFKDLCLDLVDIVSYNIYPQWYVDTSVRKFMDKCIEYIRSHGGENKPILISEIGAGAIYGYRTNLCSKWSEDYQVEALEDQITAVLGHEECSGVILWQFADCRVDKGWSMKRPKSQNNKGVVDIYRREKLGYAKVKELFHSL
ncbi:MAG: beta-glucuronidase [Lachnospiraceae bacterium]|nr:beta-glucuronidase [Lachnospiraceae bacterium]